KLPAFVDRYAGKELRTWGVSNHLYLQPVSSIHTTTGFVNPGIGTPVEPGFLTILALIAVLIQVIACINFMNLSTARASQRAKEVGVRKVIGSGRPSLIRQFLAESFLMTLAGILIALPLLAVTLPWLNRLTQASIAFSSLANYKTIILLVAGIVLTALLAG